MYGVCSTSRLFSGDSGTAKLLSPRIFQPDSMPYRESAQAVILVTAPLLEDTSIYTDRWKYVNPSISEGRLYSHNGTISEYMVSSVLPAYSADSGTATHVYINWNWGRKGDGWDYQGCQFVSVLSVRFVVSPQINVQLFGSCYSIYQKYL